MNLPVLQFWVKMKCVSNNVDTLILIKVNSGTHIPHVLWAGLVNAFVFSPVHKDLLNSCYMLEREAGVGNIKMTRI